MCTNMIVIMTGLLSEASSRGAALRRTEVVSSVSLLITGLLWDRWQTVGFPNAAPSSTPSSARPAVILGIFFTEPPLRGSATARPAGRRPGKGRSLGMNYYRSAGRHAVRYVASFGAGFGRLGGDGATGLLRHRGGADHGDRRSGEPARGRWCSAAGRHIRAQAAADPVLCDRLAALRPSGLPPPPGASGAPLCWLGIMSTCQPLQQALATDMLQARAVGRRGLALLGSGRRSRY